MNRRDFIKGSLGGVALSTTPSNPVKVRDGESHGTPQPERQENGARDRTRMDFGWKFALGHLNDIEKDFGYGWGDPYSNTKTGDLTGPTRSDFDDGKWQTVDVPHDWGVGVGYDSKADESHGYKKIGRAWPENSVGWYRKNFEVPASDFGKRIWVEFDGVFRDSQVWLNAHPMGRHESGYTSFAYDLTDYVNYGGKNVLTVRADAAWPELWSYEGGGIYRHVWLVKTDPLHVARWGTFIQSEVHLAGETASATLRLQTTLVNQYETDQQCTLISTVLDPTGNEVAEIKTETTVESWEEKRISQKINLEKALLWSVESPHLYRLITTVRKEGKTVDSTETPFGIRTIRFDPDKGFFLNGKHVLLKGLACHPDHGGVGTAVPDRVQEFRIEKLKEMGANAYRCAHNPVAPELLDACDRLGMLVMNEVRMTGSTRELIGQMKELILRDRNHPSVILWSLGNEEHKIQTNETGSRILRTMGRAARRLDPTRPITLGIHGGKGGPVNNELDVIGCNYERLGNLDELHRQLPDKPILVSESISLLSTRGVYEKKDAVGRFGGYDENIAPWGTTAETHWNYLIARPWLAGTFVWIGIDYGGEPFDVQWPTVNTQFGVLDRCCFPKDIFYFFQSWWSKETVLHLFPHWNWEGKEGEEIRVGSYSNCEEVELFVNDRSLGKKPMPRNSHLEWKVKYEPGWIEVRGTNRGLQVATKRIETVGKATGIRLKPDRIRINADNQDVSLVTLEVVDERGRMVPTANHKINFRVTGGRMIGACNGDPACKVLENRTTFPAFNGLMMALVQSMVQSNRKAGKITLQASSAGLEPAQAVIDLLPVST